MPRPPWFKHAPEQTATGYRWLDTLTSPYWRVLDWWSQRKFWRVMRVGKQSWREARRETQAMFRAMEAAGPLPSVDEILRRIEEQGR